MKSYYIFLLMTILFGCQGVSSNSIDQASMKKPKADVNTEKVNKKVMNNKTIQKPIAEYITVDGIKQPYWKSLKKYLNINDIQISELKKITKNFQTSRKNIKNSDKEELDRLRTNRNYSVQKLLGKKLARKKILYDKEYYKKI